MRFRTLLFTCLTYIFTSFLQAQQVTQLERASNSTDLPYTLEKVYLHLDRSYYKIGDKVWYKIYLLNAHTHKKTALSAVVYVDLINSESQIIETQTIKIEESGGHGSFELPTYLVKGEYTIRAYTNYMRNFDRSLFFRKKIYINSHNTMTLNKGKTPNNKKKIIRDSLKEVMANKPDLQFFPEGGHMMAGFINTVGFKALNYRGKGIDVSGVILDSLGKEVVSFKTSKFGMGKFKFIPQKGENYKAIIKDNNRDYSYKLPIHLNQGVAMNVVEYNDFYKVLIQSSSSHALDNFKCIGLQRKGVVFSSELIGNKTQALISVPKNILEEGIVQFTLLDHKSLPVCERLVFFETIEPKNKAIISSSNHVYGKRELVKLNITLDESISQNSKTNVSLSVANSAVLPPEDSAMNIKNYLLLQSELKGHIEHPGYYFNSNDTLRKQNLDLLMMTQGWRQYILNDATENKESDREFLPEQGITLSGNVKKAYNHKKPAKAEVSLAYNNDKTFGYGAVKTDAEGRFVFKDLNFTDTTTIVLQSSSLGVRGKKNKSTASSSFYMKLDTLIPPKTSIKQGFKYISKEKDLVANYINSKENRAFDPAFIIDSETIILDAALVKAKKPKEISRYDKKRMLYKNTSHTLDFKDLSGFPTDPLDALRIFGVYMKNEKVLYQGDSIRPKFLLNGFPSDYEAISFLPVSSIDFIDVLKRNRAAIYGVKYVIAVYTLDGSEPTEEVNNTGIVKFNHPGYSVSKVFYQPKYAKEEPEHSSPDMRTALSWSPTIKIDKKGQAQVSFYTADMSTTYKVSLEGITADGEPLVSEMTFDVE